MMITWWNPLWNRIQQWQHNQIDNKLLDNVTELDPKHYLHKIESTMKDYSTMILIITGHEALIDKDNMVESAIKHYLMLTTYSNWLRSTTW